VRVFKIIHRVVGGHRRRRGNEFVGYPTHLRDLFGRVDIWDNDEAVAFISGALCIREHWLSPSGPRCHRGDESISADITQDFTCRTIAASAG
jgi:hypothetical protein